MENNEEKEVREYTNEDILKAIGKLPEDYQNVLMANLTIYNIKNLLNSKKDYEDFYSDYIYKAYCYSIIASAMKELFETIDSKLEDEPKDFSDEYGKLSDVEKKYATVSLMNNAEFKKNYSDILEHNFNKVINLDETTAALNSAFGLSNLYKKILDMVRNDTYRYEVCDERGM